MSAARGHAWRVLRRALPAAAFSLVFLLASAGSFVLHLGTNAGRRLVAREANALVSGLLVSGLAIEHIAVLAPGRLRVSRATLLDRLGKPVLRAEGLEARFGLFTLLRGILGEGAVRVAIDDVRAERVSVWLTRDPARGGLTLETAFDTRTPSRPGAASTPVFVSLPHLAVATAVVATDLPGIERSRGEVSELLAGFDVSPKGVVITLKSDDARVTGLLPQEIRTRLDGSLRFPGTSSARLPGHAGGVPFEASAGFRGDALELALRSDAATPAAMQKLVPGWPLLVPFAASAEAKGTPRELAARLEGRIENAKLSGAGRLAFTPELRGDLAVHVGGLDLRWFAAEAPATALEVDGRVALALTGAGVTVEATATLPESELSSLRLPPLALTARYAGGHVTGNARVLDPRLATDIDFTVAPGGALAFSSTSRALELGALERYGVSARGRASLRTQGSLTGDRLVVSAETVLDAPSAGGVNARRAVARGRVEGSLRALRDAKLDLVVEGARLELAGIELERFRGTATGTLGTQTLGLEASSPSGVTLEAGAKLSSGGGASLVDARLASRHGAASLEARAERVGFEAGGVTVDGLVVRSGDGGATGSLSARGSRRSLELTLAQLDLGQAFGAFGLGSGAIAGRLDGRARLEENGHERSGHVGVKLTDGAFGPLEGVVAELGVEFEGAELRVDADVGVPALGSVKLQGSGQLEASLFEGRAARELAGEATLSFAALDLGILGRRLLPEGPELAGQVSGKWRVARAEPNALPSASYELQTHGLVVSRKVEGDAAASAVRLDVDSVGELFGERGSHVALSVLDAQGPWLAANIEHGLGAAAFADAAARGAHELERAALGAPLKARVTAYRRPLKMLDLAGASTLEGALSGSVELAGTAELPELAALVTATAPRVPGSRDEDSLEVELHYSAEREHYSLEARTPDDADRVRLRADGHFGWLARGLGSAWSSQGMLLWSDVGLGRLGRSIDVALEGQTSGHCSFDLAPASVTLDGAFEMSRVALDRRAIGSARGRLRAADGRGEASL
ncbi:MAG TPA: hypothetical protein VGQ57_21255, partial [Polyangiaceae bacterium]|nr:hypothetical protein [Polyangiaceae bacterium]